MSEPAASMHGNGFAPAFRGIAAMQRLSTRHSFAEAIRDAIHARAKVKRFVRAFSPEVDDDVDLVERAAIGRIRVVDVVPKARVRGYPRRVVYVHGGGLVFHDIETFMPTLTRIASLSNCTVTALDYPKAPEVSPVVAIQAVNEALGEIVRSVVEDGECLPALVGDSIGGLIVLAAARHVPAVAKASLFLIYPVLDLSEKRTFASRGRYARSVFLDEDYMRGFRALARSGLGPDIDPLSFGVEDFERLGRIHIVSARCDVLSDEALAFVDRGRSVGTEIDLTDLPGLPHDFLLFSGRVPDAENGLTVVARALSEFLDKSGAP